MNEDGTGSVFTPAPSRISNRALIARMEDWLWSVDKISGEDTTMKSPAGYKVVVRSGHTHVGTNRAVIADILDAMGLSWEEFIAPPPEAQREITFALRNMPQEDRPMAIRILLREIIDRANQDKEAKKQAEREKNEAAREARRVVKAQQKKEKTAVTAATQNPTPMPKTTKIVSPRGAQTPEKVKEKPVGFRGRIINRVFDALVDSGEPMSVEKLTEAIPGARFVSVRQAASNLAKQGVVEKVKQGVYKVKPEWVGQDVRIDVVARSGDHEQIVKEAEAKAAEITAMPEGLNKIIAAVEAEPVIAAARAIQQNTPTQDETINDVLDLLFPDGFRAKHLPLIDAWRRATVALMNDIGAKNV